MNGENILANDMTDNGLIFKISKQLIQFNNKQTKKTQSVEWEKIFANNMTNRETISKIHNSSHNS